MRDGIGSAFPSKLGKMGALPTTIITAMVSPIAREKASTELRMIEPFALGSTIAFMVCHGDIPRPKAVSS